jgi:hypothetical protein
MFARNNVFDCRVPPLMSLKYHKFVIYESRSCNTLNELLAAVPLPMIVFTPLVVLVFAMAKIEYAFVPDANGSVPTGNTIDCPVV